MKINHQTDIPLFVALGASPFIVWAVMWISGVSSDAKAALKASQQNTTTISDVANNQVQMHLEVVDRLARIETKIDQSKNKRQ